MYYDIYEYSSPQLVRLLGERFKGRRIWAKKTQEDVAKESGVSVTTIRKFENGRADNIALETFLQLLRSIGKLGGINELLPEVPPMPHLYDQKKKIQRVRHK